MGKMKSTISNDGAGEGDTPRAAEAAGNVTSISAARGKGAGKVSRTVADAGTEQVAVAPAVIVFGRDEQQKPHASWFGKADAELAVKAAGMMGMQVLRVTTDEHRAAASGLAAGRVFASGRGFVPFAKESAFAALAAFPEGYQPPALTEPEAVAPPLVTSVPQRFKDIAAGSLVLAREEQAGWFESIVTECRGGGGADLTVARLAR